MSGKMRPALLNQVLEAMNIMERQAHPAFGKAKRDCIRTLVNEKLLQSAGCPVCTMPDGTLVRHLVLSETCGGDAPHCPGCGRWVSERQST